MQVYPRTKFAWKDHHNTTAALLAKYLMNSGYDVLEEPSIQTEAGIRKHDIVALQFTLTIQELQALRRIRLFTVTIYVKAWFSAPSCCDASFNNRYLLQNLKSYAEIDSKVAAVPWMQSPNCTLSHGWQNPNRNTTPTIIPSIFDRCQRCLESVPTRHTLPTGWSTLYFVKIESYRCMK